MDFAILSSSVIVYAIEVFLITGILSLAAALFSRFFIRNAAMRHAVLGSGLLAVAMTPAILWLMPTSIRIPVAHFNSFIEPTALKVEAIARNEQTERSSTKLIPMSCSSVASQSNDHNDTTAPSNSSVSCSSTASVQDPSSNEQDSSKVDSIARPSLSNLDPSAVEMSSSLSVRTEASAWFDWALTTRFWLQLVIIIWMVGSLFLVARIARGLWMVHRMIVASTAWKACDRERVWLQQKFSRGIIPEIRISTGIASPLLVGWLRGVILLPAHLQEKLTANQWREILLHETAHWERRDHWMVMIERILVALLWPQVFVQVLCKELGRSREELCDNLVLSVCDPLSYAKTLLQVAESSVIHTTKFASVGFLMRKEEFKNRVSAIIDSRRSRALGLRPFAGYSIIASAILASVFLCGVTMQGSIASHYEDENKAAEVSSGDVIDKTDRDLMQNTLQSWKNHVNAASLRLETQQQLLQLASEFDLNLAKEFADQLPRSRITNENFYVLRKLVESREWETLETKTRSIDNRHIAWWLQFWGYVVAQGRNEKDFEAVEFAIRKIRELSSLAESGAPDDILTAMVAYREFVALDALVELLHEKAAQEGASKSDTTRKLASTLNAMNRCIGNIPLASPNRNDWLFYSPSKTTHQMRDYLALESWDRASREEHTEWNLKAFESSGFTLMGQSESKELRQAMTRRNQLVPAQLIPEIVWFNVPPPSSSVVDPWIRRQLYIGNHDAVLAYAMIAPATDEEFARILAILIRSLANHDIEKGKAFLPVLLKTIDTLPANASDDYVEALMEGSIACFALSDLPSGTKHLKQALASWPNEEGYKGELVSIALDALSFVDYKEFQLPFDLQKDVTQRSHSVRGMERSLPKVFQEYLPKKQTYKEHDKYNSLIAAKAWKEASLECIKLAKGNGAWLDSLDKIGGLSADDIGLEATLEWSKSIEEAKHRISIELGAMHKKLRKAKPYDGWFDYPKYVPQSLVPGIEAPSRGC